MFNFRSLERRRPLPPKILLLQENQKPLETVLLKLFGYLLFYRERLQIQPSLEDEYLPFIPDFVQLNYEGRIALWVDCGETPLTRLDRLAVKAPDAEIWVVKGSFDEAQDLLRRMHSQGLRSGRYGVVGLDSSMLGEVTGLLKLRNDITWHRGGFDPALMQFEFNGLWFESEFVVLRH